MSTGPSSECLLVALVVLESCESTFGRKSKEICFNSSTVVKLVSDEGRVSLRVIAPRKTKNN